MNAASYDWASQGLGMAKFFYVYILQSHVDPEWFYSGLTDDSPMKLKRHNSGQVLQHDKVEALANQNVYRVL